MERGRAYQEKGEEGRAFPSDLGPSEGHHRHARIPPRAVPITRVSKNAEEANHVATEAIELDMIYKKKAKKVVIFGQKFLFFPRFTRFLFLFSSDSISFVLFYSALANKATVNRQDSDLMTSLSNCCFSLSN